jgi:hypothetical protein
MPYLIHSKPLFRINAARVATLMPQADKVESLTPLLNDDYKSVRVAANQGVLAIEMNKLTDTESYFKKSIKIEPYLKPVILI